MTNLDATSSEYCEQDPAQVRIFAEPDEDIHLQLVWDTPGDRDQTDGTGTDVDLHFLHPNGMSWFDRLQDCFFGNPSPDWGNIGQLDDNPSSTSTTLMVQVPRTSTSTTRRTPTPWVASTA